jgi:crotonobetainyl-CoA:carnitine CoA-transferase CaiB-like acyl-CoA transferase
VFDAVDCCVTPVLTMEESLDNPQLRARGMVMEVGGVRQFGPPVRLSGMPAVQARPAPVVAGADSDTVLAEAGFSPADIERLRGAGAI